MRLLGGYVRRYFLQWLAWRSFALTLVANQAVTPLVGLAVWSTVLPERRLSDYFIALLFVRLLTSSYENHTFSEWVYQGGFCDDLLLPHPPVLVTLGENIAIRIWHIIIGLPIVAAVVLFAPPSLRWQDVALALPAVVLAAAIRFLFTYALALSAFWIERAHSVVGLGSTLIFLLGGEAAPIALLPDAVRPWAEALPFRAMLGFPAEIAAGELNGAAVGMGYLWQVIWLAVMVVAAQAVWRAGIRRYTVVGG
ncbi:MAG: hypothetical protein K0R39_5162 [Symbiobacteriaceae bacterium]|jgi:ABC-2 type transport system permease protein|nr:hypothetical protein [Symbiobacteriaceae bacterium]